MKPSVDIIILGAKPIKGMKSLGAFSNIKIDKKNSILSLQISNLKKKLNIKNIIYVGGYQCSKIETPHNIKLIHNKNYIDKNNAYSLKLALPHIESDYLIILFNKTLFNHSIFNRLDYETSSVFVNDSEENSYGVGCIINDINIQNVFYNLPNKLCGIYGLAKNEIDILKTLSLNDNLFIFEIINDIISNGGQFKPKYIKKKRSVLNIDNSTTLKKIKRYYVKNFSN